MQGLEILLSIQLFRVPSALSAHMVMGLFANRLAVECLYSLRKAGGRY